MVDRTEDQGPNIDVADGAMRTDDDDRWLASGDKPATIRAHIEETKGRMSDTVDEIGDRLNPHHLAGQVKQNIHDATVGKAKDMARNTADQVGASGRSVMQSIRANPVPAALVAVGLGWLVFNSRQQQTGRQGPAFQSKPGPYEGGYVGREPARSISRRPESSAEEDGGTLARVGERANELLGDVKQKAADFAGEAQETIGHAATRAQSMVSSAAEGTRHQSRRVEDTFHENPLAVGVATLAAGIAVGLALPRTEAESQLVGGMRDDFMDKARDAATETQQKVQRVVDRVADEAQHAAHDEGLSR